MDDDYFLGSHDSVMPEPDLNKPSETAKNGGKKNERDLLLHAIEEIQGQIDRYTNMVDHIWDNRIVPFIESCDCNILENLSVCDFGKFCEMMYNQPIYRQLIDNYNKLNKRLHALNA